jgi:hypothetical protein
MASTKETRMAATRKTSRRDFVKRAGAAAGVGVLFSDAAGASAQVPTPAVGPETRSPFPTLNRRTRGWLRFLWDKTTTMDDWSSSGVPHQWWDVYATPGVTSYGRFDLQTSSYALLLKGANR